MFALIIPISGGFAGMPDNSLPGMPVYPSQGLPVYPSQGLPGSPGHPSHGLPGAPVYPSQGLPGAPVPGQLPALPPGVATLPPMQGQLPAFPAPPTMPPGTIWPPLPPGTTGKVLVAIYVSGHGSAWTVIDTALKPGTPLPPAPAPKA